MDELPTLIYTVELLPEPHATYISPEIKDMLGSPPEAWLDDPTAWQRFLYPEDAEQTMKELAEHNRTRKPFSIRYRMVAQDGRIIQIRNSACYQEDKERGQVIVHGVMQDVSAQMQAVEALRASKNESKQLTDFFLRMTNIIPDMIWTKDVEGRYTFANQAICDDLLHAKSLEEPIGKTDLFFANRELEAHPDDPNWFNFGQLCAESDVTVREIGKIARFDEAGTVCGKFIHLEVIKTPLWDENGNIIGTVGTARDITEHRKAEAALKQSEERNRELNVFFRNMTDVMADFLWAKDLDLNYTFVNRATCEKLLYAVDKEEPIGKKYAFFADRERKQHPDNPEWYNLSLEHIGSDEEVIREGKTIRFEASGHVKGQPLYLDIVKTPLRNEKGDIIGIVCSGRDITERKSLEDKLRQRQKLESVGRLAGGVAHDFNNMLQTILGNAEMALDSLSPNNPARESLMEIRKAAERSANLTRQLLAFARKQTILPHMLNLNATIEYTLKMLRRIIGENIHLQWKPVGEECFIKMDPAQMDQILVNLCINSRDAIEGEGTVLIETDTVTWNEDDCLQNKNCIPGHYVVLRIRDTGKGMSKDVLEHIFEPFFTTKGLGENTGLGLSTVYGIVQQNNGIITVQSEPDQGTTFQIYFPRFEHGIDNSSFETASGKNAESDKPTILLVEDELSILNLSERMLSRMGYHVIAVSSPTEALRIAQEAETRISLLVTDVIMPEMNGSTLSEVIQKRHPGIQSLFISGYSDEILKPHGVLNSGVHFFQKPFTMNALAEKIRNILAVDVVS
ncbi:MAG: PAS domain-containing protein [Verrucomicrobiota bacterium]|jgi:PAS domain S-box-containing protein|nr:PAS domain-containing protein [Verrucomicrobiota bacterium]